MSTVSKIFAIFPSTEVYSRILYKRLQNTKLTNTVRQSYLGRSQNVSLINKSWENYKKYIDSLGINKGDILIVHSSMDGLKGMNVQCKEILDYLLDLVGMNGTLAMPAFPYYKEKEIPTKFEEEELSLKKYNPQKTPSWTGLLPNYMCSRKEAIRSPFPYNSLVAIGREAKNMMKMNLDTDLPHGKNSAWAYCSEHHAKVLFLGVEPFHSTTAIHVCEDSMDTEWPINGWYKNQEYEIQVNGRTIRKLCRERKQFWNQYLTEQYCSRMLIKSGNLQSDIIEHTYIGYIKDMGKMTEYVTRMVTENSNLLFYKIPRKYWKKRTL